MAEARGDRDDGAWTPEVGMMLDGFDLNDPASSFYDDPYEEVAFDTVGAARDGEWLDRAVADILSANVPFERVGIAARTGFTADEVRSVLRDPGRLRLLTMLWKLTGPGPGVLEAAVGGGPIGEAHLALLSHTEHLARLRSRSRYNLAASTGGQAEVLVDDLRPVRNIVVTRQVFQDDGLVDIAVEMISIDPAVQFPVMAILGQHGNKGRAVVILFLLTRPSGPESGGSSMVTLPVNDLLISERMELYGSPLDATELSGPLLAAVPASVAAAKRPWKEAWRRAALASAEEHPLRQAVLDGLSARP